MNTAPAKGAPLSSSIPAAEWWLVALTWAAAAMLVRAWWLQHQPAVPMWDGEIYHRTAERISRGLGFIDTWNNRPPYRPTAFYPVGYPAFLGGAYALLGPHRWVAGLLNVLAAGACTFAIVGLAARALGRRPAHVAAALYTFSPGAIVYTSAFMTEPVSAALLCGALAAGLSHMRTGRVWSAVVCGLCLGIGGLVRPPTLLVAPVFAVLCAPALTWRSMLRSTALVGAACTAMIVPWTARNCRRLDACAIVSVNGGSNLWIGTDAAGDGGYRDLRPREGCDGVHGEVAKDRCYGRMAIARIRRAPMAWLGLAPRKVEQLLDYEGTPVWYLRYAPQSRVFEGRRSEWARRMTHWHFSILTLAALGLVRSGALASAARRNPLGARDLLALGAIVGAFIAVHAVFFGADRYHFAFTPLLCILAGGAFRRHAQGY